MDKQHTLTEFQLACPKCGSQTNCSVERLNSGYSASGLKRDSEWHDRVFACTCGKRLYGLFIKAEYDQQLVIFEGELSVQRKQLRAELRAELRKEQLRAEEALRIQELTRTCGWSACNKVSKENSKYCSRTCSNRNARHRYKERQKKAAA